MLSRYNVPITCSTNQSRDMFMRSWAANGPEGGWRHATDVQHETPWVPQHVFCLVCMPADCVCLCQREKAELYTRSKEEEKEKHTCAYHVLSQGDRQEQGGNKK